MHAQMHTLTSAYSHNIAGGSLIEGPELVHRGDYYYLFFAAGKYCQESYSEGVARSRARAGVCARARARARVGARARARASQSWC